MIDPKDITKKSQVIRTQLDAKLGVKSRDLSQGFRRAGRRLPRGLRAQAAVLARAEVHAGHPNIARQIDGVAVDRAYREVSGYLRTIDVADARKHRLIAIGAVIGFNLMLIIAAFVTGLWWHGYV